MMSPKRVATEKEKRDWFIELLEEHFGGGHHKLTERLGLTKIPIVMKPEDQEALLQRMMITPYQIDIEELFIGMVMKKDVDWLCKRELKLRSAKSPTLAISFKHYAVPPAKDGGWNCKDNHPCMKPWAAIFKTYGDPHIMGNSGNMTNLRTANQNNLPIDVIVTQGYDAEGKGPDGRKKRLLRFIILPPLAEDTKGFNVFAQTMPVKK